MDKTRTTEAQSVDYIWTTFANRLDEPHLRDDAIVLHDEERPGMAILRQVPLHFEGSHFLTGRGVPE